MPSLSDDALQAARQRGDAWADDFLARQLALAETKAAFYQALGQGSEALWAYVAKTDEGLQAAVGAWPTGAKPFWRAEAQQVFAKRGAEVLLLLGLYSLPYCYAAADGAAVLVATGRLSGSAQALVRLQETARFVHTVLAGTELEARQACLHVRLIHALVRHHLLQKDWPVAQLGLPVNQEDMAGTNLAFGYLTVRGLRLLGLPLSAAEAEAYLGWFSVLGTWLGVEQPFSPASQAQAYALASAIERRHHRESPAGLQLIQALLESFKDSQAPALIAEHAPALMAALLGPKVSACLGLPPPEPQLLSRLRTINTVRTFLPVEPDWLGARRARREVRRSKLNTH